MNRSLHHAAFAVGLLAVAWIGAGYFPGNPLALALVLLIGAFFVTGGLELHRFQQATAGLAMLLRETTAPPPALAPWIATLHPSLQNAVRLRVEGERVALPGPALTPYLVGLLVLLGMLGTFLGMIVTLKGTGLALENATDVEAIRASLAAPVKGLGLAFGTSVAGVAASAMLGLMSALARRDRSTAAQRLDARIATTLRGFSQAHQREESLRLLRAQTEAMPALVAPLVAQLQGLVAQTERQALALQDRLLASQTAFQDAAARAYTGLAESVDQSLKASLAESARLAGAAIEPAVQATMTGLAREAAALRESTAAAVRQHLDGVAGALTAHAQEAVSATLAGLERHAVACDTAAAAHEQQRMTAYHDAMAAMTVTLQQHARDDGAASAEHQRRICATLEDTAQAITAQTAEQTRATLVEIERLVQAAADAPRIAAQVIGELRSALSDSLARDNAALDERNRLMTTLAGLLDAVNHASTEQRAAIDALVTTTTGVLDRAGARFADTVAAESRTLQSVSAQVAGGAAEVASLGEGFGAAVGLFSGASEQLMAQLQRLEAALGQAMTRSDEQLAYYVAQAREIIDLTLGSQKQIVEDLQKLAKVPAGVPVWTPATAPVTAPTTAPVKAT